MHSLNDILKSARAKKAFEALCRAGCKRNILGAHLLAMASTRMPRGSGRQRVQRDRCRHLETDLLDAARELQLLAGVLPWWLPALSPAERKKAAVLGHLAARMAQAAETLGALAEVRRPLGRELHPYYLRLDQLLRDVREQTGRPHYQEVAELAFACREARGGSAAANGEDTLNPGALRTRAYRETGPTQADIASWMRTAISHSFPPRPSSSRSGRRRHKKSS